MQYHKNINKPLTQLAMWRAYNLRFIGTGDKTGEASCKNKHQSTLSNLVDFSFRFLYLSDESLWNATFQSKQQLKK